MSHHTKLPPSPSSEDDDNSPTTLHSSTLETSIELSIGDIIWLKLESYPWWPAKIVDCNDSKIPSSVLKERQSHLKLVKFFNSSPSEEYYWIDPNKDITNVKLFKDDPFLLDNNITALKNHLNLKKAIHQAKQLCGLEEMDHSIHGNHSNNSNHHSSGNTITTSGNNTSKKRKNESNEESESKKIKDLVILTDEELNSIKEELSKSIEMNNINEIKHYLSFIHGKCNQITVDQLKSCKIGMVVAQLRKQTDETISKMAKEMVKTWTSLISSNNSNNNTNTTTSNTTTTSNGTPTTSSTTTTTPPLGTTTTTMKGEKPIKKSTINEEQKPKIKKISSSASTTSTPTGTTSTPTAAASTTTSTTTTSSSTTTATTTSGKSSSQSTALNSKASSLNIKPIKTTTTTTTQQLNSSSTGSLKSPTTPLTPSLSLLDASKIPQCSEGNRNRWRQKIGEGLIKVPSSIEDRVIDLCVQIETAVHDHFKNANNTAAIVGTYDDHCRTLSRNLNAANNDDFRSNVYHSIVTVEQLPVMKVQDMASKEKQKENALLQERKLHGSMVAKPAAVESSMFRCGKCKKTQCTFYEMQTRSADEPMTAFITCLSCGNRWKQ